ncbi:MAG: FAD-binding oxidoreductase [Herpetosiphonaceae bacterium]|nr:MAG: FAD-binding oxidoreductase [Herpetosiphonaceae bacterium]
MRRWNGWGDDTVVVPLSEPALELLGRLLGPGTPPRDATLSEALAAVPSSRLPTHPLISVDPLDRLHHARGQSLPDWIALRSGRIDAFPDGVAYPASGEEVRALIDVARATGVRLIPYGGGTSVVGHVNPRGDAPVLTVDMRRLSLLQHLDEKSRLATFGAGVVGPALEAQLRARGYTLGHFPQSFEYSTLGGWVATRSSGQQSLGYGRIEQLFAGGRLETPAGTLELPPFPASAAGPDLRQLVLGSEGRLGILTEATVRVTPLPEREAFHAVFFPDWECALAAARSLAQAGLPLSMLRLSTPVETATTLALAGHARAIGALERLLALRGAGDGKCLLLLGFTGRSRLVRQARREALAIARSYAGIHTGQLFGKQWRKSRFRAPYLRNTLWELGYAVDTLETATTWSRVSALLEHIETALRSALLAEGEQVHVFTHLSHVYPTGSSIYTTFVFRIAGDACETLRRWQILKETASRAIIEDGGTISHQHGVGADHRPYLAVEKGALGMAALHAVCSSFDPDGLMDSGNLL